MIHKIDELKKGTSQIISPTNDLSNRIGKLSIPLDNNISGVSTDLGKNLISPHKSEVSKLSKINKYESV